ncbi:MAG: carbonic anhydrase family protein [Dehalococcoidia bacterium]
MTERVHDALSTRYSRRVFGQRATRWSLAGTVALIAAACGSGVTPEDLTAVRDELNSLKTDMRKLQNASGVASKETAAAHGEPASNAPAGGVPADAHAASSVAPAPGAPTADAHAAAPGAHWSYEGATGPEGWAHLAPENAICATGSTQSPIDISFTQQVAGGRTVFRWNPNSPLSVVNNGHTIQANLDRGSTIEIDGTPYDLLQFHFHAPSEHTIEGRQAAMETHFVHKNGRGDLAVIGVLHALGQDNSALAPIWTALPKNEGDKRAVPSFDLLSVLPGNRQMFRYSGSLTTPPCSEGVRWHVMQSPTTVSQQQVSAFLELFKGGNARPIQPLKARDILKEAA